MCGLHLDGDEGSAAATRRLSGQLGTASRLSIAQGWKKRAIEGDDASSGQEYNGEKKTIARGRVKCGRSISL